MMALLVRKSLHADRVASPSETHWVARATVALVALAGLLIALASPARADDDLPGRVGRVADYGGQLYLAPEDRATDWVSAGLNYTVTSGDNLWVSSDGRAEIDYGGGQFRLAGNTNVHVSRLDDRTLVLFVAQGRVVVRVRFLDPGDVARVDTPNTQVQFTRPGLYRVEVGEDRRLTQLVVREGEAELFLAGSVQQVLPGQTATASGEDPVAADVRIGYYTDGFDAWSGDRDRRYERSRAPAYVSRQMIGYADLDEHGTWQSYPDYGAVWFPTTVAVGWAPYRAGRWAWVGGWGWTWVDDAPWGYAPFHYGRWAWIGGRWGWCPGGLVPRPVWAPAMVAWYGGSGWAVSVSAGAPVYGWVPLGWREPYIPWWRNCSNRCWAHYNRPYAVPYNERPRTPPVQYVNNRVPGAFTAVSGATLAAGRPVHRNIVPVAGTQAATAPVLGAAPVAMRPSPNQIHGVRPGTAGTPPPASSFYPTNRPPRGSAEAPIPTRTQPAPGGVRSVPPPGESPRSAGPAETARPMPAPGVRAVPPAGESPNAPPATRVAPSAPPGQRPIPGTSTPVGPTPGPAPEMPVRSPRGSSPEGGTRGGVAGTPRPETSAPASVPPAARINNPASSGSGPVAPRVVGAPPSTTQVGSPRTAPTSPAPVAPQSPPPTHRGAPPQQATPTRPAPAPAQASPAQTAGGAERGGGHASQPAPQARGGNAPSEGTVPPRRPPSQADPQQR